MFEKKKTQYETVSTAKLGRTKYASNYGVMDSARGLFWLCFRLAMVAALAGVIWISWTMFKESRENAAKLDATRKQQQMEAAGETPTTPTRKEPEPEPSTVKVF